MEKNKKTNENINKLLPIFEQNIRIPDVYHVSLTFKSLLPSNLNQYLFQYIGNTHIINNYNPGINTRAANVVENAISGLNNVKNSIGKILDYSLSGKN